MLTVEQQDKAKEMLRTEVKAYFDVRDELGLSQEEYYELIRLDVHEWRIRAKGKNISVPQELMLRMKERYLHYFQQEEEYPYHKVAQDFRVGQRRVTDYLKKEGIKVEVKKKPFTKDTRTLELEKHICNLYDLGISYELILVELNYQFNTNKSIADILKKYGRSSKQQETLELHLNSGVFDFIETEEQAYWLGVLYTDGWISQRGNGEGGKQVGLSLHEDDLQVMEDYRKFLGADAYKMSYKPSTHIDGTPSGSYQLLISSVRLYDSLVRHGFTNNKSKDSNPKLELIPIELQKDFWRGCIDGDGGIYYGSANNLTISFIGTIDIVHKFLGYLYYNGLTKKYKNTYQHKESKDYRGDSLLAVDIAEREDVKRIIEHFYSGAKISMKRKEKYLELV